MGCAPTARHRRFGRVDRRTLAAARARELPILTSFADYRRAFVGHDLVAGLTVWAVLGLYAAPAALTFYAVFGSSRHLVVGPTSATAALSAAAVADLGTAGGARRRPAAARLPRVVHLRTGAEGFIIGLALTIIMGQLPKLFGVPGGDGDFRALLELRNAFTKRLGHIYGPSTRPDFIAAVAAMFGVLLFRLAAEQWFAGDTAGPRLATIKELMSTHNAVIMMVVLLVLGAKLFGTGIAGLGS